MKTRRFRYTPILVLAFTGFCLYALRHGYNVRFTIHKFMTFEAKRPK